MRINPCHGCPLGEGCQQREEYRERVKGIGARSVNFECPILTREIRRGRRIVIKHPFLSPESHEGVTREKVPATITAIDSGHRFACIIDKKPFDDLAGGDKETSPDKARFRRYQAHTRIVSFLDEPDGRFCRSGQLYRGGQCDVSGNECWCENVGLPPFSNDGGGQ